MIRAEKSYLPTSAITHPGMKGKANEDRFAITAFCLDETCKLPSLLAVLSDGIGGHRAGEVASEMAVNLISQKIAESDGSQPTLALQQAVQYASDQIFSESQKDAQRGGMGATCACAWLIGSQLYAATVGDSRIYLIRGSRIYQLSTDHTWIQEALEIGLINKKDVPGHPNAHVIRRYLGSPEPPVVDLRLRFSSKESDTQAVSNQGMPLRGGDLLILCSDGLTDLVKDEEILAAYHSQALPDATQSLVDLANSRGGHDNITLLTVQFPVVKPAPRPWRVLAFALAGLLAFAVLAGGIVSAWLWYSNPGGSADLATPKIPSALPSAFSSPLPAAQQSPAARPSATLLPLSISPTSPPLPLTGGGPTLTPWPTNTLRPTNTLQPTFTPTSIPQIFLTP